MTNNDQIKTTPCDASLFNKLPKSTFAALNSRSNWYDSGTQSNDEDYNIFAAFICDRTKILHTISVSIMNMYPIYKLSSNSKAHAMTQSTTTMIFGNGIGMALNSEYFSMTRGLEHAWSSFDDDHRKLIRLDNDHMPSGEDELENHHQIMTACYKLINNESSNNIKWLTDDGNKFPDLYKDFIFRTAKHYFDYDGCLPCEFVASLVGYIQGCGRCHIATLNYDKLLYQALYDNNILQGYQDGGLVDGILNDGFSPINLLRLYHDFGWYLHLHGSPIYRTRINDNSIDKTRYDSLPKKAIAGDYSHEHIVLSHTKQKPEPISSSMLLASYFEFFIKSLAESNKLYIIGYSGLDEHVNFEIKNWISSRSLNVASYC